MPRTFIFHPGVSPVNIHTTLHYTTHTTHFHHLVLLSLEVEQAEPHSLLPPTMPITLKEKPLGLEVDDDDEELLQQPRRFLQLPFCGTLLAYGGEDGLITAAKKDGEFKVVQRYNDMVRAVAVSPDAKRIVVGCDDGSTLIYTFDDYQGESSGGVHPFCEALDSNKNDEDDLLSQDFAFSSGLKSFAGPQFELPIRDLQFLPQEEEDSSASTTYWLAIASESGMAMVNVTSSSTLLERELEHQVKEHHADSGVRGVALSKNFMATLAMDGRLCLWNALNKTLIEREASTCIPKKDVGEIHGADPYDRSCRPVLYSLSPTKVALATPGCLLPIMRLLDTAELSTKPQSLELENSKPESGHLEPIVCIHFLDESDTDGARYFVTSGRDSRLILWKWHKDHTKVTPMETFTLSSPATDLIMLPREGQVYAACANGTYSAIDLVPHLPDSFFKASQSSRKAIAKDAGVSVSTDSPKKIKSKIPADFDDDDDDDVDFAEADSSAMTKSRVRFVDDEADEDNDEDDEEPKEANKENSKSEGGANNSNSTPFDNDDDDSLGDHRPAQKTLDDMDDAMADLDDDIPHYRRSTDLVKAEPSIPPQAAFSPSSTPLDLARRFLCWNHIGSVTLLHGDDRNTVDISFTDSAYKRPISFTDNMSFILGSLGEDGGIFATDLQLDDDDNASFDGLDDLNMSESTKRAVRQSQKKGAGKATGSAIFFYRFETIGNLREKDWYLTLPVGERVWGAATGAGWAAVATSRKYLRFFSAGGNQGQVVWLKGEPVTMVGRGRFMAVFYHDATPLADGTQQLAYTLWDATNFEVLSEGPVSCLSKSTSLAWVGFSNDSSLMAMDSDGILSMLVQTGSSKWEWVPVLDTIGLRKSMDDKFWPITVYDGKMVCVPLKGGNTFPDAARRPVTSTLGLRLPLAASSGKS
jgi:hypothetical protein